MYRKEIVFQYIKPLLIMSAYIFNRYDCNISYILQVNGNGRLLRQKYKELKVLLENKSDRELLNVAVDEIKKVDLSYTSIL